MTGRLRIRSAEAAEYLAIPIMAPAPQADRFLSATDVNA